MLFRMKKTDLKNVSYFMTYKQNSKSSEILTFKTSHTHKIPQNDFQAGILQIWATVIVGNFLAIFYPDLRECLNTNFDTFKGSDS